MIFLTQFVLAAAMLACTGVDFEIPTPLPGGGTSGGGSGTEKEEPVKPKTMAERYPAVVGEPCALVPLCPTE